MNCFKHCVFFAYVGAAGSAYAALEFSCFIGNYVAVKIGQNKNFEIVTALFINKLRCGNVNIPFIGCDFGIILADFFAELEGSVGTDNGQDLLRQLGTVCDRLKMVGAYRTLKV